MHRVLLPAFAISAGLAFGALAAGGGGSGGGSGRQRAINSGLPPGQPGPPGSPNNRQSPPSPPAMGVQGSPRHETPAR